MKLTTRQLTLCASSEGIPLCSVSALEGENTTRSVPSSSPHRNPRGTGFGGDPGRAPLDAPPAKRDQLAGADGNRTHPAGCSPATPVLKTGGHTSAQLPPNRDIEIKKQTFEGKTFL